VTWTNVEPDTLMARVLAPANLKRAFQRVVSNKGVPCADGIIIWVAGGAGTNSRD